MLFSKKHERLFRERGQEMFRIEALSDAVLAFSVSLLVVSLEVPQTFHELKTIINGAVPFFSTVALIFLFWYRQYIFFRRYGLNDLYVIILNLVYLAIILFYIYPLKFLFSLLLDSYTPLDLFPIARGAGLTILTGEEFPELITLFSAGYFFIWMVIWLMHKRVMQQKEVLELNTYEILFTAKELRGSIWNAVIGVGGVLFAQAGFTLLAGVCYLFIPVILLINHRVFLRQNRRRDEILIQRKKKIV